MRCFLTSLAFFLCASSAFAATVPFVGCESDGQVGRQDAPKGEPVAVELTPEIAGRLAYYQAADGPGVLAPIGWNCFGYMGSNGRGIVVAPDVEHALDFNVQSSLAVVRQDLAGSTSGDFEIVQYLARTFPQDARALVKRLNSEGRPVPKGLKFGRYSTDRLATKQGHLAEFETPALKEGLGTIGSLGKSNRPISGFVDFQRDSDNSMVVLQIRLSPELADLVAAIKTETERPLLATPGR